MNDSRKLLQDYARQGSEPAFRELVARYVNMVHSTALRLVNGDSHLAEDVTQTVFLNLAGKASTLSGEVMLGGWLHRNACFVAQTMIRGNRRRQSRERQAVEMNSTQDHSAANLAMVTPLLDEAINELGPEDRTAILLRFFEQQEFRAVGEIMGSNEDAARMRVNRALDKLHEILTQRGLALSVAALGTALAAEAVRAAPSGMAASVAATALGGTATGGATIAIIKTVSMTKVKIALASAIAVAALAVPIVQYQTIQALRRENGALKQQVAEIAQFQQQSDVLQDAATTVATRLPEAQVRELARLRNEVTELRAQTNELAKARQQIESLNKRALATGTRPGSVASATSASDDLVTAGLRDVVVLPADLNACLMNLRSIDLAKQQWASENRKQYTDTPTWDDLRPHLGKEANGQLPVCPDGGIYTIGSVNEKSKCSIQGHLLP